MTEAPSSSQRSTGMQGTPDYKSRTILGVCFVHIRGLIMSNIERLFSLDFTTLTKLCLFLQKLLDAIQDSKTLREIRLENQVSILFALYVLNTKEER